jgi:hypothetical protein
MATTTPDQTPPLPAALGADPALRKCLRCNITYAPAKSTSELRLTYCSFLCELGHLGFSISGLEHMERNPREAPAE